MTIQPYPGCYLVSLIEEKAKISLTTEKDKTRIFKGKVLAVGEPMEQKAGGVLKPKLKTGDIIYFLAYEGNYDNYITPQGETVYFVLYEDGRGFETA